MIVFGWPLLVTIHDSNVEASTGIEPVYFCVSKKLNRSNSVNQHHHVGNTKKE